MVVLRPTYVCFTAHLSYNITGGGSVLALLSIAGLKVQLQVLKLLLSLSGQFFFFFFFCVCVCVWGGGGGGVGVCVQDFALLLVYLLIQWLQSMFFSYLVQIYYSMVFLVGNANLCIQVIVKSSCSTCWC